MLPVLLKIGPFTIYTFSVFLILAFLLGGYVFWRKGQEEHYDEMEWFDGFLLGIFWMLVFGRLGFILANFPLFGLNFFHWVDLFSKPGILPFTGVLGGAVFLYRFAKKRKWDTFEVLDFGALALSIGYALTWLGQFFAGTGFGNPTTLPVGMHFPSVFDTRHPTQLYGFVLYLMLFVFLFWAESRFRTFSWYRDKKNSAQSGFLISTFFIFFGGVGALLSLLMPGQIVFSGIALDVPLRVVVFLLGIVLLFSRSGRSVPFLKK